MALHFAYTNDTEKAELLNNYFASTYVKTMEHCRHLIIKRIPAGAEFDNALDNVLRVMRKLNSNKSSGPDGFLTDLFKRSASRLVLPLSILFNNYMSVGKIPAEWRNAIITRTPVVKDGPASDSDVSNYCPIGLSLTSCAYKIMERIIVQNLLRYLHQHSLIRLISTHLNQKIYYY